jgi:hypothetical protein
MKLTKSQLKRIIQEEISRLHEKYPAEDSVLQNWGEATPSWAKEEEVTTEAKLERAEAAIKAIVETEIPNMKSDIERLQRAKGRQERSEDKSEEAEEGLEANIENLPS